MKVVKLVMKIVLKVVKVMMKVVDEGSEWLIVSCLRGFENKQTIGHLKMGTFKKEWFS